MNLYGLLAGLLYLTAQGDAENPEKPNPDLSEPNRTSGFI